MIYNPFTTPHPTLPHQEVEVLRGLPELRWPPPKSILEGQGILLQLLNCKCVNIPPVPLPRPEPEPVAAAEAEGAGEAVTDDDEAGEEEEPGPEPEEEPGPAERRDAMDEGECECDGTPPHPAAMRNTHITSQLYLS